MALRTHLAMGMPFRVWLTTCFSVDLISTNCGRGFSPLSARAWFLDGAGSKTDRVFDGGGAGLLVSGMESVDREHRFLKTWGGTDEDMYDEML